MANRPTFKLPSSFISQLGEFTTGYVLITVNEGGEFETFIQADTPAIKLGLNKFLTVVTDTLDNEIASSFTNKTIDLQAEQEDDEPDDASSIGA